MCGNFGLLLLKSSSINSDGVSTTLRVGGTSEDPLDQSLRESIHAVGRLNGLRVSRSGLSLSSTHGIGASVNGLQASRSGLSLSTHGISLSMNGLNPSASSGNPNAPHQSKSIFSQVLPSLRTRRKSLQLVDISYHSTGHDRDTRDLDFEGSETTLPVRLLPPLHILEAQTASTEIRGGQAGGISSLEYYSRTSASHHDNEMLLNPKATRVRCVARKRVPLSSDLAALYRRTGGDTAADATGTFIGHTRFATSSINRVPELHPHEWIPFHDEDMWVMNQNLGTFEKIRAKFGLHISHNGDFDALSCYSQMVTVGDIGLWLERGMLL
jgi:hypothetical protein